LLKRRLLRWQLLKRRLRLWRLLRWRLRHLHWLRHCLCVLCLWVRCLSVRCLRRPLRNHRPYRLHGAERCEPLVGVHVRTGRIRALRRALGRRPDAFVE
jgi:hypothetical protein